MLHNVWGVGKVLEKLSNSGGMHGMVCDSRLLNSYMAALSIGLPRKGDFQLCHAFVHWIKTSEGSMETITRSTMHTLDIVNIVVLESVMPSQ